MRRRWTRWRVRLSTSTSCRQNPTGDPGPRSVFAEMTTGDLAVRVKNISHQFGEAGEAQHVRALLDTSLDINRGELLCLIGPSGCGKSTLLNVIGGLLTPSGGAVAVAGKPVRGPMAPDIAFVFQENALFPWNTVVENVRLGM